ncbi:MAG: helix-turn-helix domain-containing protein [Oscillospiraceae bacterium]|nr:helix-turn-helix domain-containing protein [Oscillospiraceae bacterium]
MFAEIFVKHIQNKGVTPYRIAKETGISQGLMGHYKLGEKTPTADNLVKIADYLDVSIDYLLGRTENPKINK